MSMVREWLHRFLGARDDETGALLVMDLPGGLLVEKKVSLPNATHVEADLGQVCRNVVVFVPASIAEGTLQVSVLGIATADSPEIDGSIMPRIPVPQGTQQVSFYSASNLSAKKATIWGW